MTLKIKRYDITIDQTIYIINNKYFDGNYELPLMPTSNIELALSYKAILNPKIFNSKLMQND